LDLLLRLNQELLIAVLRHKAFHDEVEVVELLVLAANRQKQVSHECGGLWVYLELLDEGSASAFYVRLQVTSPLD